MRSILAFAILAAVMYVCGLDNKQSSDSAPSNAAQAPAKPDKTTILIELVKLETDMTDALSEELKAQYKAQVPLGRYGSTDEIAATVTWLASDGAAYITGAVIPVDGGLGMGH